MKDAKRKIKDAIMELLCSSSVNDISVAAICKKAGISRTAFYNSYKNVSDTIKDIQKEITAFYTDNIKDEDPFEFQMKRSLEMIKKYKHFFRFYFQNESAKTMPIPVLENHIDTKNLSRWKDKPLTSYQVDFIKAGCGAVVLKWIENGCTESVDRFAEELIQIIMSIIKE